LEVGGHEVCLLDANADNLSYLQLQDHISKIPFEVLIFRSTPVTLDHDVKVASIAKKVSRKSLTIMANWTLRGWSHSILQKHSDLDIYTLAELERVVPEVLKALQSEDLSKVRGIAIRGENGITVNQPSRSDLFYDFSRAPMPAYHLINSFGKYYLKSRLFHSPYVATYSAKGCPYGCIFCTVANTTFRPKSSDKIIKELQYVQSQGVKYVSFFDETFTLDEERVIKICERIIEEGIEITWYCNTRADKVNEEMLKLMYSAGCRGVSIGIESADNEILSRVKKGITAAQARETVKNAKEIGMKVFASFMFGLPGETRETIEKTIKFILETKPHGFEINIAVPYPSTELYSMAIKKGWVKQKFDYTKLCQHSALIRTDALTTKELERHRRKAYVRIFTDPSWVISNVSWTVCRPKELLLGASYFMSMLKSIVMHEVEHVH
jgi:radical SAM superfamily enzyme YgiQ (UPF0313 family)